MSRDLRHLFEPASVALVGASDDPMKWGGWYARTLSGAQDGGPPPFPVWFVNRRGGEVLGQPAYRRLADLPAAPELVVLAIPAGAVEQAVSDALACGARAIVVIAAGFSEVGAAGALVEQRIVRQVKAADAVLLGPNCLGLVDTHHGLHAAGSVYPEGAVSLISQSGNLAIEIGIGLEAEGLGIARFVSVGNQADLGVSDLLMGLVDHTPTRVVAVYVEDAQDGRGFMRGVAALARAGKPPLVLKAGRSAAGAEAALSHTGALAGEARVFAAALRDAGGILVHTPDEIVDRAKALASGVRSHGRRVAVIADGGGHGVICADLLADNGFVLAALEHPTRQRLAPELPHSEPRNPVDLAGAGEADVTSFARIAGHLLADRSVDSVLCSGYFGGYAAYSDEAGSIEEQVALRLAELRTAAHKPLVVQSMQAQRDLPGIAALRRSSVPTYARIGDAIRGLDALVVRQPVPERAAQPVPTLPLVSTPAYPQARAVLAELGLEFPPGRLARSDAEAAAITRELGSPVVLKAVSAAMLHKTDSGGVVVGIEDADHAAREAALLRRRVGMPLDGVWVEAMAEPGLDLVVGARRDPAFGPVVLVGLGGIFVEALDDAAITLAPVDPDHVAALMRSLRGWPLLAGMRGQPARDVQAVAHVASRLGDLLSARSEISEVEVNPLRAYPDRVVALDARVVVAYAKVA